MRSAVWFLIAFLVAGFALSLLLLLLVGCTEPTVALPSSPAVTLPTPAPLPVVAPKMLAPATGIPPDALRWKRDLTRVAQSEWGLNAPVATMGAQIHQESSWRADAVSPVGATGLAQFMPATATWLSGVDATVGPADVVNPIWSMQALAAYDRLLWDEMTRMVDDCNRMAVTLAAYNGGSKWVARDRKQALAQGLRDDTYWENVEKVNAGRTAAAWRENRGYPKRILRVLEPRYLAAGWGLGMCED